jgi:hypothetical protein
MRRASNRLFDWVRRSPWSPLWFGAPVGAAFGLLVVWLSASAPLPWHEGAAGWWPIPAAIVAAAWAAVGAVATMRDRGHRRAAAAGVEALPPFALVLAALIAIATTVTYEVHQMELTVRYAYEFALRLTMFVLIWTVPVALLSIRDGRLLERLQQAEQLQREREARAAAVRQASAARHDARPAARRRVQRSGVPRRERTGRRWRKDSRGVPAPDSGAHESGRKV